MLIAQLTDLHVRPLGQPALRVVETNMLAERALRVVGALNPKPDVILITGDLTDNGLQDEYEMLSAILRRTVRAPVFVIPGNHDRREAMIAHLPGTPDADGFVQYVVEDFPVRIVMLDSVVPGAAHGELCARRLAWLDDALGARPDKPTLIGMHHPPFPVGIGHMDRIALREPERLLAVLQRHHQVQRILCGHHHRTVTARFGPAIASIAPSVAHQTEFDMTPGAESAFVMEPPAFELHRFTPEAGIVSHTVYVERFPGPFPFVVDPAYPGRAL